MNYELTFICSPELPADKVEELTAKVTKIIETAKGTVKTVQQLGKKKLAYPINKFREGSYVYMELTGEGEMVNAVENFFKLSDVVIRFLTIKIEKKKKKPVKPAKPAKTAAAAPAATEVKNESVNQ